MFSKRSVSFIMKDLTCEKEKNLTYEILLMVLPKLLFYKHNFLNKSSRENNLCVD